MGEKNLIDKALGKIVGDAAVAGGAGRVLELLESLETKLAHLEKLQTGSLGGWDIKRVRDVQFQTYPIYPDWTMKLKTLPLVTPCPFPVTIPSLGITRICSVSLSLDPRVGALATDGAHCEVIRSGIAAQFIAALNVVPSAPFASIVFPEPYPSIIRSIGPVNEIAIDSYGVDVFVATINALDRAYLNVTYFNYVKEVR